MTMLPLESERFHYLLGALRDDVATDAELEEIESLVLASEAARDVYVRVALIQSGLRWASGTLALDWASEELPNGRAYGAERSGRDRNETPSRWLSPLMKYSLSAAALAVCAMLLTMGILRTAQRGAQPQMPEIAANSTPVRAARITHAGVEWGANDANRKLGDLLLAGERLEIAAGLLELRFERGANLVVEGPARLEIRGDNGGLLHWGRAVARVPKRASGFQMETSAMTIIDVGTEFGVEATDEGQIDVHVFDGAVDLVYARGDANTPETNRPGQEKQRLEAGGSIRIRPGQQDIEHGAADAERFVRGIPPEIRVGQLVEGLRNHAAGAAAAQSTEYENAALGLTAASALDGNRGSYSHTSLDDAEPWWQADLTSEREIRYVVLWNRLDYTPGRLRDITITLLAEDGETVVAESPVLNRDNRLGGGRLDFEIGPRGDHLVWRTAPDGADAPRARYARVSRAPFDGDAPGTTLEIRLGNKHCLSLAEVQVFGPAAPAKREPGADSGKNVPIE